MGMNWGIQFTYDGKHLTGNGWRGTSYIQENAYLHENDARQAMDNTFWSVPAPAQNAFIREQLTLSVGEYIYGFGEKFTVTTVPSANSVSCTERSWTRKR